VTDAAISVDDVTVSLGGVTVLDGVSTTVGAGRFVGLVGPNGAGKTTLLRTINGALDPAEGRISVAGEPLADRASRATSRLVATVPQSTASTFEFTVRRIVAMGRTPHVNRLGSRRQADRRAVEDAMARVEVEHLADRPVTEVSGGERQRVYLARALAQDTPVLLLDEPTSDLDVNHQIRTLELVADLVGEGRTVLAAIHDLDLAARYCDELRLLADGRISAAGPPSSVLTGDTVASAFDTRAAVTTHPVTGTASVTAFAVEGDAEGHVHVVGGGDAATPLLHRLDVAGFDLSVGAVGAADRDARTAAALDAELVTVPPGSPVDDARPAVESWIRRADAVVVPPVAIEDGTIATLVAVADVPPQTLIVVDGGAVEDRNYAGAAGRRVDSALRNRGTVVEADGVVDAVRAAVEKDDGGHGGEPSRNDGVDPDGAVR
jgi:iron complex transport system ATP-binding protein